MNELYDSEVALDSYYTSRSTRTVSRLWTGEKLIKDLAYIGLLDMFAGPGPNPMSLSGASTSKLWLRAESGVTAVSGGLRRYVGSGDASSEDNWIDVDPGSYLLHLGGLSGASTSETYATRAAAVSATISGGTTHLRTAGYASAGDGGAASYIKDISSSTGGFQSADGAYWRLVPGENGHVNVKQFGAKGDGATDDTAAFQAAINYSQPNKMWIDVPAVATGYLVGTLTIGNVGTTDTCHFQGMQFDPAGASATLTNQWQGLALLKLKAGTNGHMFHVLGDASQPIFKHLTLHGNGSNQTGGPSYLLYFEDVVSPSGGQDPVAGWVEDIEILGGYSGGLYIGANRGSGLWRNMWLRYCGTTANDAAINCHCYDQQFDWVAVGNSPGYGTYMGGTQIQAANCVWYLNNVHISIPADGGAQVYTGCVFDQATTNGIIVNEAAQASPVSYAHGTRAFVNCQWSNNSSGATNTYSDIKADSVRRLVLVAPQFIGNLGRSATKPKYCIETVATRQTCQIRISNFTHQENDGTDVFGTAFTNTWNALVELGDMDAYIGSPGGKSTKSVLINGVENTRWISGCQCINGRLSVGDAVFTASTRLHLREPTQYGGMFLSKGDGAVIASLTGLTSVNDNGRLVLINGGTTGVSVQASGTSYLNGGALAIGATTATATYLLDVIGTVRCSSLTQYSDPDLKNRLRGLRDIAVPFLREIVARGGDMLFTWKEQPAETRKRTITRQKMRASTIVDVQCIDGVWREVEIAMQEPVTERQEYIGLDGTTKVRDVPVFEEVEIDDVVTRATDAGTRTHSGIDAAVVKAAADAIGFDFGGYKDSVVTDPSRPRRRALDYTQFVPHIIVAIDELFKRIESLEAS